MRSTSAGDVYWTGSGWTPDGHLARGFAYRGDPILLALRLRGRVRFDDARLR